MNEQNNLAGYAVAPVYFSHYYNGNIDGNEPCTVCGKEAHQGSHYRNNGKVCDNPHGPCACGTWHKPSQLTD